MYLNNGDRKLIMKSIHMLSDKDFNYDIIVKLPCFRQHKEAICVQLTQSLIIFHIKI